MRLRVCSDTGPTVPLFLKMPCATTYETAWLPTNQRLPRSALEVFRRVTARPWAYSNNVTRFVARRKIRDNHRHKVCMTRRDTAANSIVHDCLVRIKLAWPPRNGGPNSIWFLVQVLTLFMERSSSSASHTKIVCETWSRLPWKARETFGPEHV